MARTLSVSFGLALLGGLLAACESTPTGPLETGTWGGTGIAFEVAAESTAIEFDCAHGQVRGRIRLEDGRFSAAGEFVLEHGGPIREGEIPDTRDALYWGLVQGGTLTLSVRVDGLTQDPGPFTLRRGASPILRKCL